jgi:hypothetical protein
MKTQTMDRYLGTLTHESLLQVGTHDIAEILLKVALNTITLTPSLLKIAESDNNHQKC